MVEVSFCATQQELAQLVPGPAELWGDSPAVAHTALEPFSAIATGGLLIQLRAELTDNSSSWDFPVWDSSDKGPTFCISSLEGQVPQTWLWP